MAILFSQPKLKSSQDTRTLDKPTHRQAETSDFEQQQLLIAEALANVSALVTSGLGLDQTLDTILTYLQGVVPFDSATVHLLENGNLRVLSSRGFTEDSNPRLQGNQSDDGIFQAISETRQSLVLDDAGADSRFRTRKDGKPFRGWMGLPLIVRDHVVGYVSLNSLQAGAYDQELARLAQVFANQISIAIENSRLFEAEQVARERALALQDAARLLNLSLTTEEILRGVLTQISRAVEFDTGNIMLLDENQLHIRVCLGYENHLPNGNQDMVRYEIDSTWAAAEVIRLSQPVSLTNVSQNSLWKPVSGLEFINSWLGMPILSREEPIGIINLERTTDRPFSEDEIALVQTFALQSATAIQNARLYEAAGQRAAELEALRQASLKLTSRLDLPEVLDTILESVLHLLPGSNNSHVFLYDAGSDQMTFGAALWADGHRGEPFALPRPHGLTYTVARLGEAVVVQNMRQHPLFEDTPPDWKGAIVGLPLKIQERVVGVMNVSYLSPRRFFERELRLLRLLGDQAAIAIENARLFEQLNAEQRHLGLLYEMSGQLAASLVPDEILTQSIYLITQALDGLLAQAHVYIPDEDRLELRAIYGRLNISVQEINERVDMRLGTGLIGWVAQQQTAVNVPDVLEDERWLFVPGVDEDVRSVICAPVMVRERLLGILSVFHTQKAAFSNDHLDLLQAISQQVGLALTNAMRYAQVERRLMEITLIQSLAETFNQRLELQELLDVVVYQLGERLGYPHVEILLVEAECLVVKSFYGVRPASLETPLTKGIVGRVARSGELALVRDVHLDPDYEECLSQTISELVVPIYVDRVVVGVINIETHRRGQLTGQDRDLVQVLAGQVAIALENAVLYDRVRRHAEDLEKIVVQRTAELAELYELSQKIGYTLSYQEMIRLLISHLRKALNCELVVGGLITDHVKVIYIESARLLAPSAMQILQRFWLSALAIGGITIAPGEEPLVEVVPADPFHVGEDPIEEVGSLLQAPVMVGDRIVGFLIAGSQDVMAFGDDQERILDTFAGQTAAASQRLATMLAAEQKRLADLMEHLPVGVLLLDDDYHLLLANPLGNEIVELLNEDQPEGPLVRLGLQRVEDLIARSSHQIPVTIALDAAPRRIFEAQARPVGMEGRRWVITLREVTQEREYETRIQMQERLATVGQLAAGIAHDFNNIMAAILVYADLLIGDPGLPPVSRERLEIIQQQVERAASLIRQILDFSRRSVMEQSAMDLLPFIKELDKMLRRVMPETIQLELSFKPGNYLVNADPTRLQQALMNLAVNARDALPNGGSLRFVLSKFQLKPDEPAPFKDMPAGEWVCLKIEDDGVGIPPEYLPHMFEPFFTTKPVGQGTGLGLAQVYGIIKQHDGYIDVKSQIGQGTSFLIYLPTLSSPNSHELKTDPPLAFDGGGQKVLVVEDDPATREALQALLEAHSYTVVAASNGVKAVELLEQESDQVVLLVSDVVMPQMGGVALFRIVQQRWPSIKMLFVTGHPLEGENHSLLEAGHVSWLQKPFSVQEFRQAVFALVQGQ